MKKVISLVLCVAAACLCAACDPQHKKVKRTFEAMDTYITLEAYNVKESALVGIQATVEGLDTRLSVTYADGDDNEIYRVNQNGAGAVSPSVAELARQALALCEATGGALDITVAPVAEEWGFYTQYYHIPSEERLAQLLPLVDYRRVAVGESDIRLEQKGMRLDFGAVAKGYCADLSEDILAKTGVRSAILNLGGTIVAHGKKPDGSLWKVGIADPDNPAGHIGFLSCEDDIIATSGSYERCFTGEDGKVYSHIINPQTGVPADNGVTSVTIISDSGITADGLSTALFVMGREKAAEYCRAHRNFECVILTADKKAYVTAGVADSFTLAKGADYKMMELS